MNEFWLPPAGPPGRGHRFIKDRLTPAQRTLLRKLLRGHLGDLPPRREARRLRRLRRRVVDELDMNELRQLLQLIEELDLR
jgi:hypothetical protein